MTVDHLDIVVSDLQRSLRFYRELLAPLGYSRETEIVGERGERVVYFGHPDGPGSVSVRARRNDGGTPYDRYAVGLHHLAFAASARDVVDERHRWLLARGVEIESAPREYDYAPGYYAVFFYDPDGIKLEIMHEPAEEITALDHVQIAAPPGCEAEARRFFGELLGLPEIVKPESLRATGGAWFELGGGQLHVGVEADFAPARKAHPALRVSPARLEALAERLSRAGAPVSWDERLPAVRRFFTEDPWGNRLELLTGG